MPFADYEDFDACVRANSDKRDPAAYCAAIKRAVEETDVDDPPDVAHLADIGPTEEGLDALCERQPDEWARYETEAGVAWVSQQRGATVYRGAQGERESTQQQGNFSVDVLEVRQSGSDGPGEDGDLLGMAVDFPEADVYVDWNIEMWPDDQQLSDAHVSIYSTVDDLRNATGNTVETVETVGAVEAQGMFDSINLPSIDRQQDRPGGYAYPDAAPPDAPREVRDAVARYREEVPDDEKADTPLLYWLLGAGTPAYKMAKADADYQSEPNGDERCGNCEYAYEGVDGGWICAQVAGSIDPDAWCRLWAGAGEGAADEGEAVTFEGLSDEAVADIRERYNAAVVGEGEAAGGDD